MQMFFSSFSYINIVLFSLCYRAAAFSSTDNNNYNNPTIDGTTKNEGVGPCDLEHLQQYNINDVDRIVSEWTANIVQKAAESTTKLQLGCQSSDALYVDSLDVVFPRVANGIGLELQEIAGGRSDGLGITVVSTSDGVGAIHPGDSIAKVSLVRRKKEAALNDKEVITSVVTECLGYDATVQAIQSLPPFRDDCVDSWQITVRRIRRKPVINLELKYPPALNAPKDGTVSLQLFAGENVRQALLARGYSANDSNSQRYDGKVSGGNCGAGGLCRTCVVAVETGADLMNPPRVAEQTMFATAPRLRLACKTIVGYGMTEGTVRLRMYPNQW